MNSPFSVLGALIPKWWKRWASVLPKTRVSAEEAKTGSGHQKQKRITLQNCPAALEPWQIAWLRFGQCAGRYWGDGHIDSAEFGPTTGTIPVGSVYGYLLVMGYGDYAVYCKSREDGSGRVSYIIAHTPSTKASTEPPSSVLEEFTDRELAILRLRKWAGHKPTAGSVRAKKQRRRYWLGQIELDLGPLESKREMLADEPVHQRNRRPQT